MRTSGISGYESCRLQKGVKETVASQSGIFYFKQSGPLTAFPQDLRRSLLSRIEPRFLSIFCGLLIFFIVAVWILSHQKIAETAYTETEILKIQERYAQLVLNQPKEKAEEKVEKVSRPVKEAEQQKAEGEETEVTVDRKKESVVEKQQRKEASSEDRRKKRDVIKQQLQSAGIFAAITATSGGGGAGGEVSSVTDLLGSAEGLGGLGSIGSSDIKSGSFATKEVDVEELKKRRGERTAGVEIQKETVGTVSGSQLASVAQVNITSEQPEISGESAGKGSRDQAAINAVVSRQQSQIKKVYEAMLKRDPNLSGKIVVKFTIMPDGSVTDVSIVKSSTNNETFDSRIISYIKRWVFPPIDGGSPVEVVFPFVFSGSE